mmetsp:Transcript_70983/g.142876  ORF Transcript_70983/g.142876 Transcript_70983/m.142876 type:complete len:142 (+) Transcript_70983:1779-2204(+)
MIRFSAATTTTTSAISSNATRRVYNGKCQGMVGGQEVNKTVAIPKSNRVAKGVPPELRIHRGCKAKTETKFEFLLELQFGGLTDTNKMHELPEAINSLHFFKIDEWDNITKKSQHSISLIFDIFGDTKTKWSPVLTEKAKA